jgi:outer membrane protein assembly factor BamB
VTIGTVCVTLMAGPSVSQTAPSSLEPNWSQRLASPAAFSFAADSNRLYVPLQEGSLLSLNLRDGGPGWTVSAPATGQPAAGEELVFLPTSAGLEARSSADGTVRWRTTLDSTLQVPLVWDTGWLIAATDRGEVLGLRGADGQVLWRRTLKGLPRVPPVFGGSHLYVALEDGNLVALAVQTGEVEWTRRPGGPASGIVSVDDQLFLGSADNRLFSLASRNGSVAWRRRIGGNPVGAPALDAERVYFVSLDNEVRALDRRNGSLRWQHPLPLRPSAGPFLIGGMLLVPGVAAEFMVFHPVGGTPAGVSSVESQTGERLYPAFPPRVVDSPRPMLVVLTRDGLLESLSPVSP